MTEGIKRYEKGKFCGKPRSGSQHGYQLLPSVDSPLPGQRRESISSPDCQNNNNNRECVRSPDSESNNSNPEPSSVESRNNNNNRGEPIGSPDSQKDDTGKPISSTDSCNYNNNEETIPEESPAVSITLAALDTMNDLTLEAQNFETSPV